MTRTGDTPEAFTGLTDLSLDATGTFVLHVSDEYFAPADNLLLPGTPAWREGEYTGRGKWMDGWESRRRPGPGDDSVIVRLGTPGTIEGVLCDTTHFKGNAPEEVSLEALDLPGTTPVAELVGLPAVGSLPELASLGGRAWLEVLPRTRVQPDRPNALTPGIVLPRASHVRLRIRPDGGVARLRIFGRVRPDAATFWGAGSVDLAAIGNGGAVVAASDAFFGPAGNLLLPGRGVDMGDGWETRRRRTPGSDWCVVRLGRRGIAHRLEIDTHFFKGNSPVAARIEYLDAADVPEHELPGRLSSPRGWFTLIDTTPLAPHRVHVVVPPLARVATHVRLHILPHGGVNRLRVHGHALDTLGEAKALATLHALAERERDATLRSFCACTGFASGLSGQWPAPSIRQLFACADRALGGLREADWLEAFAAHPRLGEAAAASGARDAFSASSREEQSGLAAAPAELLERLRAGNRTYEEKFGFLFLACAAGRGAGEIVALLEERLAHDRATEFARASREQARITRRRMGHWLQEHGAS